MNDIKYIYKFEGILEICIVNKLFKIKNKRIISDIEPIFVNDVLYLGKELEEADEITFLNERIIYFKTYLLSSRKLDLKELKIEFDTIKDREPFFRKYNDKEIKPFLDLTLKKVNLLPIGRQTSFISFLPMVMMSLASLSVVVLNVYQKNKEFVIKDNISQLILPLVMLISTLLLQPLIRFSDRNRILKDNRKKVNEYKKYLLKLEDTIKDFKRQNNNYLNNIYLDQDIINNKIQSGNIYQYLKEDDGYLVLTLGRGIVSLDNLKISNSNSEDNEIGNLSREFITKNTKANIGPILLDLKKENNTTIVCSPRDFFYLDFLLLSLFVTIHPSDLKTAVLINEEYLKHFSYLFDILHLSYDFSSHIFKYDERQYKDADLLLVIGKNFNPKLKDKQRVLYIVEKTNDAPAATNTLVVIDKDKGQIKRKESLVEFHFKKEEVKINEFINLIHKYDYPKTIGFNSIIPLTDLYPIEYSTNSLKAVLGKNERGLVTLDLDETKDGPHGLIVGMTGSGKSELLLTLVLSLSLNYSPNYLNFVVIDFKGGGIVNILNNKERKLKHLVSSLTNIDAINFERILVSFKNEIIKRQLAFKDASEISGENITNIKEYQMLLKRGIVKNPIPHLLIILDEFAEIKKEHSEVIEEFLSISRVGRSLGIHLILCTQRAQGVIDDEIKSNAGFKICLKVNSKEDSREVIETDDATEIKEKGGFYLLTNNIYTYGKSAYTNADIYKSYLKKTELLNSNLEVIDRVFVKNNTKSITEASKIIDVLNIKYQNINLDKNRLWLDPLSCVFRVGDSKENEYTYGLIDDYHKKRQYPATFSYLENNLVISTDKKKKEQHLINCLNDLKDKDVDVYLLNLSKYKQKESIALEITEKDEYEINYLLNLLDKGKEKFIKNTLIIISDLKTFMSLRENNDFIKRAIEQADNYNYKFLIYANSSTDYTYSFSLLFNKTAYIGDLKSDEILNIYSKNYKSDSINDGLVELDDLLEFKLFEEKPKICDKKTISIIKQMPTKRKISNKDGKFLLGYTLDFVEEFYLDLNETNKVIMASYDEELLDLLIDIFNKYGQVKIINAEGLRNIKREIRTSIVLFFGSGIIENYDLNFGIREDLEDDEMIYIYKNKKVRIKYFNEWY